MKKLLHKSILTEKYNEVNSSNVVGIINKAIYQFNLLYDFEDISGFYIVEWRINFHNVFDFIISNYPIEKRSKKMNSFIEIFEKSVDVLYKRLGIE